MNYVIFDLETTGLDSKKDQIIEIAASRYNTDGKLIEQLHEYINLYKVEEISDFITNLTKIDNSVLEEKGCDVDYVFEKFDEFIKDSVLVAQNIKFDYSFLATYYFENQNKLFTPICLDVIDYAKAIFPGKDSYKLSELVKYFDVSYDENAHHQADYDVFLTSQVFLKALDLLKVKKILKGMILSNFVHASDKQKSFLESLAGENKHFFENKDYIGKTQASFLIDYYIKN